MRKLFSSAALVVALSAASAGAQIVTKLSAIQPLEQPSSYAEKFFAEQVAILTNGVVMLPIATCSVFSWIHTQENLPRMLADNSRSGNANCG